jgi:aspartate/methionine/tyrosine aminotransferase
VLSGASKVLGLPQLKVAWIAVGGAPALRDEALARLEFAADAFLSVSPIAARALPALFAQRSAIRSAVNARVAANRAALCAALAESRRARVLPVEAGWAAILEVPRRTGDRFASDEQLALAALEEAGVLIHPGSLFELEATRDALYLVATLLGNEDEVAGGGAALARLLAHSASRSAP